MSLLLRMPRKADFAHSPTAVARELLGALIRNPEAMAQLPMSELDLALRLARRARLLGRFACQLQAKRLFERLPPPAVEQLASASIMVDARARVARWEVSRVGWAMRHHAQIRIIILKGCAYAFAGLPNAAGRPFADVDLLVAESDLETVEHVLKDHGWRSKSLSAYDEHYYRAWTHELPPMVHVDREVEVDLHHNILPRTARLKPSGERLLREAQLVGAERFETLADTDLVLHAMTHLMFDSDMSDRLRDLVDIDDLLRHFSSSNGDFLAKLNARAAELDLSRPAFYALRYAHRLLGTPVHATALRESRRGAPPLPIVWVMDRLVPRALFPQHPDRPSRLSGLARFLLYTRSLWIRMPPLLLLRHLAYKLWVGRVGRRRAPS